MVWMTRMASMDGKDECEHFNDKSEKVVKVTMIG